MTTNEKVNRWLIAVLSAKLHETADELEKTQYDLRIAEDYSRKLEERNRELKQLLDEKDEQIVKLIVERNDAQALLPDPEAFREPEPEPEQEKRFEEILNSVDERKPMPEKKRKRGGNPGLSEEQKAKILEMAEQGLTGEQMAQELGVKTNQVFHILRRHGISLRGNKEKFPGFTHKPPLDKKKALALHKAGWDLQKIADELHAEPDEVKKVLMKEVTAL